MKVSIIIPTKDGGSKFRDCLRRISDQETGFDLETIIIDSGSNDHTLETAREHCTMVKTISPSEFGHGYARNLGASLATGECLVFCNQDVLPANNIWLDKLVSPLAKSEIRAVFSRQMPLEGTPLYEQVFLGMQYPEGRRLITWNELRDGNPLGMTLFSTVSGAMSKETWRRFGFSNRIIMSEDQEIGYRILNAGYPILYEPASVVLHSHAYTLQGAFRRYFDSGWSLTSLPAFGKINKRSLSNLVLYSSLVMRDNSSHFPEKASSQLFILAKALGYGMGRLAPHLPAFLLNHLSYTRCTIPISRGSKAKEES